MKEKIYELLKQRAAKHGITTGFDIHQINNAIFYGKEEVEDIYKSMIELSEEKNDIEIYHQNGPTETYDQIRIRLNEK